MKKISAQWRFGLRFFLVLLALLASLLAWTSHVARNQRQAVAAIQAAGGTVFYDYHESAPRTWSSGGTPRGPDRLRKLLGAEYFDRVVYVRLFGSPKDISWIDAVNQLGTVKTLLVSGENVTDQLLDRLHDSSTLVELHLTGASVSDEGISQLPDKFRNLRWLVANHTPISDRGIRALSSLWSLEELNLQHTSVTDAAIPMLCQLKQLTKLDVRGTKITSTGLKQLKASLPNATILGD